MKRYSTFILVAIVFMAVSAILYLTHYAIFRDTHHIFIFMLGDLAFLPLEVYLVVIVIERILTRREKQAIMQKLNMVVGAFFSEVGTELLKRLLVCYDRKGEIVKPFAVRQDWTHNDFKRALEFARALDEKPLCQNIDLDNLKVFLLEKQPFLLRLLENPNLLEHEIFSDLLLATFHLTEEFESRPSLTGLPESDLEHISGDINRLYGRLVAEWVSYVEHLKADYPYLFSLVVRTHPFQESPSAVVGR